MSQSTRTSAIVAATLAITGLAHASIYNEAVDGDLADIASGGTFFDLSVGVNTVTGELTENPAGGIEEDFVVFEIGAGEQLTSVVLTSVVFSGGNFSTGFRLYADLGSGLEQIAPGSFDESNAGDDYLTIWDLSDVGGSAPLGPGTYGIALAEFTPGQQYSFDLTVVPAPGSAALLAAAGFAAARRRR